MFRDITSEELQRAFDLAFVLHPREDVALRVTMDACDFLRQLESSQARRTRSATHWKAAIPQEQLLQYAVYMASYERELDQESPRPFWAPKYVPTREDRIVRYVKHIIWKTYLLNARSIAVGIGCLLYAYKPSEIADLLFLFEERSLRIIKMRLAQDLRRRFANDGVVSPDGKSMRTIPASHNDWLIVQGALKAFTPWGTDHLETPTPNRLMLEMLFDENNSVSDWQRKHALIDPECAGLAQLINEYNNYFSSNPISQRLADPRGNLMLPDFGGGPDPSLERFKRRLLTDSEKMFLNERRKPTGRWAYLAEVFWFLSELVPMEDSLNEWLFPIDFCDEDGTTMVTDNAECENHEETMLGIYGPTKDPSECSIEIIQMSDPRPVRFIEENVDGGIGLVIGCAGLGRPSALSLLPKPLVTFPPVHIDDPQSQHGTTPRWIMIWGHVGADDEQSSESRCLRIFDVFEEVDFLMTRYPRDTVLRADFAFDADIGSTADSRVTFAPEKQMESSWMTILDFGVSWSATTAPIELMQSLIDLNQYSLLVLTMNQAAGEWLIERKKLQTVKPVKKPERTGSVSSSRSHFFHFSGHGFKSPPEPSCSFGGHYRGQDFSTSEIEGANFVLDVKHGRSHTQRQRPARDVLELKAQTGSPNHYDNADAPFLSQSRPTQPFTFQGL